MKDTSLTPSTTSSSSGTWSPAPCQRASGRWQHFRDRKQEAVANGHRSLKGNRCSGRQVASCTIEQRARERTRTNRSSFTSESCAKIQPLQQKFTPDQRAQILIAQQILQAHGGKGSKDAILVKGFRSSLGSEDAESTAEFTVKGVLQANDLGVIFEVEPTDEQTKELLGGKTLSMKVAIQGLSEEPTDAEVTDDQDFLAFSTRMEGSMLKRLRVGNESAQETIERTGVVAPTFCANLEVEEETGQVKGGVFHRQLLFSPMMNADFLNLARQQRLKGGFSTSEKVLVVKRMLMALGHVHAAGVLHNEFRLDKCRFDEKGNLFLTDFAGAAGIGKRRDLWSRPNAAPEQVREIQDGSPMTGTEKGEGWGAGMAAFLALTNQAPFEWAPGDSYLKRLFKEEKEVLSPHFDVKEYPSPTFAMRKANIPEEWVCAVTALLQPGAKNRATVKQVLQQFPHLFE
ncbi:hypothetical protein Emed_000678 [Eimeria media]